MQACEHVRCKEHRTAKFKKTKIGKKKKVKVSQSDSHTLTVPHKKKKKKMLSFIYKFHFILYKFIQSFSEIKRERERLRVWEREKKTLREGRTAGGSNEANEHRSPAQRQRRRRQSDEPMTDLPSTMSMSICDEGRPLRQRRRWARYGDNDDDVTVRGLLGLVLVCVLGIFFFFFW